MNNATKDVIIKRTNHSARRQFELMPLIGPWLVNLATVGIAILAILIFRSIFLQLQAEKQASIASETTSHAFNSTDPTPQIPRFVPSPRFAQSQQSASPAETTLTYNQMFHEIALQYNLDWRLLVAVAYQESGMNPMAVGRDNDMGLMQIIPSTWQVWSTRVGVSDPFDPYSNVRVGAAFLAYNRDVSQSRGYVDPQWMLIGYNWGPNNLRLLFDNNGNWAQVPEKQRRYALQILQTASAPDWSQDEFSLAIDIDFEIDSNGLVLPKP